MTYAEIENKIRNAIKKSPEDCSQSCKKYAKMLGDIIVAEPKNTNAYSLLAITNCEAGMHEEKCIKYLYKALENDELTDDEIAKLNTNIASFYMSEFKDDEKAKEYLDIAMQRKSVYPETLYGLALYYSKIGDHSQSLPYFTQCVDKLGCECKLNYIVCLIKCEKYDEALAETDKMLKNAINKYTENYLHYMAAVAHINKNNKNAAAKEISQIKISSSPYEYVDYAWLADICCLLEHYGTAVKCIEKCGFSYDNSIMKTYLYSLKQLGRLDDAFEAYNDELKDRESTIETMEPSDFDSQEMFEKYKAEDEKAIEELKKIYEDTVINSKKPDIIPEIYISDDCFYIGCPRHS